MAKTEERDKSEEKGKLTEEQPQVLADRGRVRSKEDEEALDKKIAEIRKKNQLIEQRKELVEEDRANFVSAYGKMGLYSRAKRTTNRNKRSTRPPKPRKMGEWDREWDAGKTSVENWKENVPDIDKNTKPAGHFPRGAKNRVRGTKNANSNNNSISNNNNNSNNASKKVLTGMNEKRKSDQTKFTVFIETNKKLPQLNRKAFSNITSDKKRIDFTKTRQIKLFDGKNSKNIVAFGAGGGGGTVLLRSTHLAALKPLSSLKPFSASFNGRQSGQPTRNYGKMPGFTKRYSSRRIVPAITPVSVALSTAAGTQQLDTVKVNVSALSIKQEKVPVTNNNNNSCSNNSNNGTEKLTATAAVVTAPPNAKEHGDEDTVVAEDVKKIVEKLLLLVE